MVNRLVSALVRRVGTVAADLLLSAQRDQSRMLQLLLASRHKELVRSELPIPRFGDVEYSVFSQNGEDGILQLIFAVVGTTNKRAVEICAGDGIECNTANLVVNH